MFKIEHSLPTSCVAIFFNVWVFFLYHGQLILLKNKNIGLSDSGIIYQQTTLIFTLEKLLDLVVNFFLYNYKFIDVYSAV